MSEVVISLSNVSVRYRLAREKPKSLQEYLIRRLKGKRLKYEDLCALRDITVTLFKGQALGIVGANGAGKSTLLKVVAGVLKPAGGTVVISGKIAPLIELGTGFDPELTGMENIYLNASILGLSRKEIERKMPGIMDFSELGDFIYSPLKSYSSGMVARLGFSIATEVDPDILIVDEILAVGDEHFKKKCNERMSHFKEKGVTMLFVSHNMEEIKKICNEVLWLDHGSTKLRGAPEEVTKAYLNNVS